MTANLVKMTTFIYRWLWKRVQGSDITAYSKNVVFTREIKIWQAPVKIAIPHFLRNADQPAVLLDIKDILKAHCEKVLVSSSEYFRRNYVNVRRGHVLDDGINKINRPTFQSNLPISVKFADDDGNSEGAVDTGGPTREFFQLAVNKMFLKTSMFQGPDGNKVLVHNIQGKYTMKETKNF